MKYGRKVVYFECEWDAAAFIELYRDLFVKPSKSKSDGIPEVSDIHYGPYSCIYFYNNTEYRYRLSFLMNHDDYKKIQKALDIKSRKMQVLYPDGDHFDRYQQVFIREAVAS